ncbi:MAG: hypothetical protein KatS3mg035_2216 [Bacteroidia bacterium]|nr:MAG: hypothetical protein KatS3mg035_2216 [Bacteroidia bacterium]
MAVYRIRKDSLYLYEIPLYGSSRLGVIKENKLLMTQPTQNNTGVMSLPIPVNIAQSKNTPKPSVYTMGKKHYETTDWLGNVRVTYTDKKSWQQNKFALNVSSSQDYYPFGSVMEGRNFEINSYRFGFNGFEKDDEVKGSRNWYAFGDYGYTPRVVKRISPDPKAQQYSYQSPYFVFNGNPLYFNDPTGQSAEATIDKKTKTITVRMHLIFYGNKAETHLSHKIATGIASQWNSANGKVTIDGVEYKVKFRVSYQTVSIEEAKKMAATNKDIKNNFILVDDLGSKSSAFQLGGNAGYFNTRDDIGGSTTPAHEIGHGLGLQHTTSGQTREERPDIMTPRGTIVHPRWSKKGPSNEIDPNFRQVNQKNITEVFKNVSFDNSGRAKIGSITNTIFYQNMKDER